MASKYVPSQKELQAIMKCYAEKGTYSAVAREFNLSPAVATRIVKENKDIQFPSPTTEYTGPQPAEFPVFEEVIHFYSPSTEWSESYAAKV